MTEPRRGRTALVVLLVAMSWSALSSPLRAIADAPDSRLMRVERWLKAVLHHEPGSADDAVVEIGSWSNGDLGTFWTDAKVLARLMRDPRLSWFNVEVQGQRTPRQIRYTPKQLHRLKVLACAAAGILTDPACVRLKASEEVDAELRQLAERASVSRLRGDDHYVLRRGALLHADVAMSSAEPIEPIATSTPANPQQLRIRTFDGRAIDVGQGALHWEIARVLLDAVTPGSDPMVRLWYRATGAWMQSRDFHDTAHLKHARAIFPNDADILFLSASEREAYARPAIQSVLRDVVIPAGFSLDVGSDRSELREAESLFRRTLAVKPAFTEAHLRLGRVLLLRGQHREAADELRRAIASADEDLLRYYGVLFLGTAEEALGEYDGASASYARAAELYPTAQSPHLALSALARRRGDRAGALREIQRVFELASDPSEGDEPWWTYHLAQARNAEALLDELRQPFVEVPR